MRTTFIKPLLGGEGLRTVGALLAFVGGGRGTMGIDCVLNKADVCRLRQRIWFYLKEEERRRGEAGTSCGYIGKKNTLGFFSTLLKWSA